MMLPFKSGRILKNNNGEKQKKKIFYDLKYVNK